MADTDPNSLYWCPLCEAPAPSVGACKIHISRCNDPIHWGYAGNDLHEEIVERQLVTDRGLGGKIRRLLAQSDLVDRSLRMATGLIHR